MRKEIKKKKIVSIQIEKVRKEKILAGWRIGAPRASCRASCLQASEPYGALCETGRRVGSARPLSLPTKITKKSQAPRAPRPIGQLRRLLRSNAKKEKEMWSFVEKS